MTTQHSETKLNINRLGQRAEMRAVVVSLTGADFGTPKTPALREVEL